jgi:hypothetical protein
MSDDLTTEDLKALQLEKEKTEEELARKAPEETEAAQHERRADKARYLREKLKQREQSERE